MALLIKWFITALAIVALPYVFDGVTVDGLLPASLASACLIFIHLVVKPVVKLLTLPINVLSLGLFSIVLNGLFFWFVADFIDGLSVDGFVTALLASLGIALLHFLISKFTKHED